jgi:hypothetical protein
VLFFVEQEEGGNEIVLLFGEAPSPEDLAVVDVEECLFLVAVVEGADGVGLMESSSGAEVGG